MITYSRFRDGLAIIPKGSTQSDTKGELEFLTTTNKLYIQNGTINDPIVSETVSATLTNKVLTGNTAANLISGSGTIIFNTSGTITVPNTTDTLVGRATTDTLTNKTLTGNTAANLISGSGTLVLNTSGSMTIPNGTDTVVGLSLTQTLTNKSMDGNNNTFTNLPSGALPSDVVYLDATQTLTNKTLTSPVIATIINTGTLTLPTATTTLVGRSTTDTLTNKTLTSPQLSIAATSRFHHRHRCREFFNSHRCNSNQELTFLLLPAQVKLISIISQSRRILLRLRLVLLQLTRFRVATFF
jgi:hypothetical protein